MHGTRKALTRRQFLALATVSTAGIAAASGRFDPALARAAQESTPAAAGPAGGVLTYAETGDFNDFNPWGFSDTNAGIYNQVFSRLLWKDAAGETHGDLAEAWELAEDGLSLTVRLRPGALWHDGTEVTAEDFVTMYGYTKDETLVAYSGVEKITGLTTQIADVQAPDARTIEMQFSAPIPYITDILDYWFAIRIADPADPEMLDAPPVGTGPFTFAEWEPSQYVRLQKSDDFYREGEPLLDELMFRRLAQPETLVPNLQSGSVAGVQLAAPADVGPMQESEGYWVEIVESGGSIFNIIVNVQKPPFDQQAVRQALSHSLNREGMAQAAFFGVSSPIVSPFFSPSSLGYREDLVLAHPYDLERAAALLAEAGVSGLQMTMHTTPRWPQMALFALIWQADLQSIGVNLTVNEVETAQFYEIGGAPDLLGFDVHPWVVGRTTRDPAIFWSTQSIYRGSDVNRFGYQNEELEALVAEGAVELDEARRREIYQQLNQIVVDSCHIIQVATDPRAWAFSDTVSGVHFDLNGNIFVDTAAVAQG